MYLSSFPSEPFQILLGLRDTNDELVRASLLAVAELVPILGGDVVIGTHRDKIFAEGKPKVRSQSNQSWNTHYSFTRKRTIPLPYPKILKAWISKSMQK